MSAEVTYERLVGFGEAMLRFTAPAGGSIETAGELRVSVGGAELNGLIAAARSGMTGTWVSALPDNPLGRHVLRHARGAGVDVVPVATTGPGPHRLGLYFLDPAVPPRAPAITYDRAGSAFALLDPDSVGWEELLTQDACLYVSGITPPLGHGPRAALKSGMRVAGEQGCTVALDANYRGALWSREEFGVWLKDVLPSVDILAAGAEDLRAAGVTGADPLRDAVEQFDLRAMITSNKRRGDQAMDVEVVVVTAEGEQRAAARAVVVDEVGAGDAMFGTFLAALPRGDVEAAAQRALGGAVASYGLFGDALVADPWDGTEARGVIR